MKFSKNSKFLTLYFLIFLISNFAFAQNIYQGNCELRSQFEVDNFPFSEVTGSLTITSRISNLIGLTSLVEVGGDLIISGTYNLRDLSGLENLIKIGGSLRIESTNGLSSLTGVDNLFFLGGGIILIENHQIGAQEEPSTYIPGIQNITALSKLTEIGGAIILEGNYELESIDGLNNLTKINGLKLETMIYLKNLNGLENITSFGSGGIQIRECPRLADITALSNLTEIGSIVIEDAQNLTSLTGLNNVQVVNGIIDLVENHRLLNLDGFENLETVTGRIIIAENNGITNIDGFKNLRYAESISIWDNPLLENPCGLFPLLENGWDGPFWVGINYQSISKDDILNGNICIPPNTQPIANAGVYTTIILGETLILDGSESFDPDGDELSYLWASTSSPEGSVAELQDETSVNPTLTPDLAGEYVISLVVNDGTVDSGPDAVVIIVITPEKAVDDLIRVVIDLDLPKGTENSLTSKLENAQKSLEKGNTGAAINQLEAFINSVEAQKGKKIPEEEADILIADAERIIEAIENGLYKKGYVAENSSEDVIPTEYSLRQNYPNPFNPSTTISYAIPEDGNVNLKIYDVLGNEVANLENGYKSAGRYKYTFDASELSSGIYFYTIKANEFTTTKKMLLMK